MLVANHNFGMERMGIPQLIRGLNAGRNAEDRLRCSKNTCGKVVVSNRFLIFHQYLEK